MDVKDLYLEIAKGNIPGYTIVHKFGIHTEVINGIWSLVSETSISGALPASGSPVRIKAGGDAADAVDGAGAREITVVGIDTSLAEVSETITTSGTSSGLATEASFWRVHRAYVSEVGAYGEANTDDITIENSDGTIDRLLITAGEGQTQHGAYSVPAGKAGYLLGVDLEANATKAADFRLFVRNNFTNTGASISSRRVKLFFSGVLGQVTSRPHAPYLKLNALSDIWIEARGGGANTEVSADFEILLVDDPSGPIRQI